MLRQAVDIEIQAKEIMYHKANLNRIMSECTGQPIEKVACSAAVPCTPAFTLFAAPHIQGQGPFKCTSPAACL